jgi:hypothetical protein
MDTLHITNFMKIIHIKSKLKHSISTMIICGSHMHEFSVSKDMKILTMMKGERRWQLEGGGTFISNTNYQRIEN